MKLDNVTLTNADPETVCQATYAVISALQQYPGEVRALAAGCHLHLLTEIRGVSPQDIMTPARNVMASPDGQYRRTEFRAARDYMENEA